jgi:non-canonical poly(A) RNA polymerase PAPD5/7
METAAERRSDIDLVVSNSRFTEASKGRLLAELARAMRMAHITDVVAIISKARVPIIKFVTTEGEPVLNSDSTCACASITHCVSGKLNVDISLNQTNGISAGKIINQYLEVLPGARQLIMVVKAFLSQRSMNEVYTGGIGSYAVICLVISFLQASQPEAAIESESC